MRGDVFYAWIDPALHCRTYDEVLDDGTNIDVKVRLSRAGNTQLFIGVYDASGEALHEESFATRPGESMSRALLWGIDRAQKLASSAAPATDLMGFPK